MPCVAANDAITVVGISSHHGNHVLLGANELIRRDRSTDVTKYADSLAPTRKKQRNHSALVFFFVSSGRKTN